jgi:hypothetical protein
VGVTDLVRCYSMLGVKGMKRLKVAVAVPPGLGQKGRGVVIAQCIGTRNVGTSSCHS